jgi:hypothetical protein
MKKIPVYVNPYDKVHFGPSTVMTLHRFGIFDPDVARRVPTLSPFSAKLTAHLRFQGIPFEPVAEQGVGNAPRGKVPFITVDGVKVADSDLVIGFLKTAFPNPDAGLSDHQLRRASRWIGQDSCRCNARPSPRRIPRKDLEQ